MSIPHGHLNVVMAKQLAHGVQINSSHHQSAGESMAEMPHAAFEAECRVPENAE
jgi:hypothetical protein